MKQFKNIALLFAVLFSAFAFTACGDDEDEAGQDQKLAGTWVEYKYVDENLTTGETETQIESNPEDPMTFNADGTGYIDFDQSGKYNFNWHTKGDKLTMKDEDGETYTYTYSVSENELRLTYSYTDEGNSYRSTEYYKRVN